jgi:hypothetical protein
MVKKVTPRTRAAANKTKKQRIEYPIEIDAKLRELLVKYDLPFQSLFDYLVVSGVVFLKREILDVIQSRVPEFKDRFKRAALARFKKERVVPDMKRVVFLMYDNDFDSLTRFCIEENIKKYWVFEILMTEFVKENPILLAHIENCKALKISARKTQLDRLEKPEFVTILNRVDAEQILLRNTKKYDSKEYSGLLQQELREIARRGSQLAQEAKEEESEDAMLEAKIARLKTARDKRIDEIEDPIDL